MQFSVFFLFLLLCSAKTVQEDIMEDLISSIQHINFANSSACLNTKREALSMLSESYFETFYHILHGHGMLAVTRRPRLHAVFLLVQSILMDTPEGDFVETGVFTGGPTAIMMKLLKDFDGCKRKLYAFDSFEGLPTPV